MKISIMILFFIVCICNTNAQRLYSPKNLQTLPEKELNIYALHSIKLKKTGAIVAITGAGLTGAGLVVGLVSDQDKFMGTGTMAGAYMFVIGIGGIIVGVPILITGSSRLKKVYNALYPNGGISFEIVPYRFYNSLANNNQTGITFRMKF